MGKGSFLLLMVLNFAFILLLFYLMRRNLEKRLSKIRTEIEELEDLAVAIIEELQENIGIENNSSKPEKSLPVKNQSFESNQQNIETKIDLHSETTVLIPETTDTNLTESATEKPEFREPRHQQILELSERGLVAEEIARSLNIGLGEVKLVLGLYKRS
ncbi:MAG TPA: hypothetical protein PLZ08_07490 [Bacillota bacterium]|nr:hypothetical protein [Bacillota bacterium]HOL10038.1 hypothetical protein [Bacillota bacterium]HPO97788.1 hypothetical protein [Bacillota bacterium]